MMRMWVIIGLMWAAMPVVAQGTSDSLFTFHRLFPGAYTQFAADNLDNLYLVNESNQLKKCYPNGDSVGVFNNVRKYGRLHDMDVTNPLKLLLFYREFATVVVLDRFLQIRNVINLREAGIFNVQAIGTSYDNNCWVFDEGDGRLKKITDNGTVALETNDLRQVFDTLPSPVKIIDQDGYVYCYDPLKGCYIFDIYGNFKQRIPLLHWQAFAVYAKTLFGIQQHQLVQYETTTRRDKAVPLPAQLLNGTRIGIGLGKLYSLTPAGVLVFQTR